MKNGFHKSRRALEFIFFPVKCKNVIMMAKLKEIGHGPHILLAFLA